MAYTQPTVDEILSRVKTYFTSELLASNPTDQNSMIYSFEVAMANLANDLNSELTLDVIPNCFPQTAKTVADVAKFATWKNINKNEASKSSGKATVSGTVGVSIPIETILNINDVQFRVTSSIEISTDTIGIQSITRNGSIVTVTTTSNHNFASNVPITLSGILPVDYCGTFVVTATDNNKFTFNIATTPDTTGTGTNMLASADIAVLNIESKTTGKTTNLSGGDGLAFLEPISGVNGTAYVQFSNVSGGADEETDADWQTRVVKRFQNPITVFNHNNLELQAKKITGVTKVWVQPCTPNVGQVTVYFLRGNDVDPIPDANECKLVKDKILEVINVKDDQSDIFVKAPIPTATAITISGLNPSTVAMKTAIKNSLTALFQDNSDVETILKLQKIKNAIGSSFDSETGSAVGDYTLIAPTADVGGGTGVLPTLGTITFS